MATPEFPTIPEDAADDEIPKWKLAHQGIQLIINNKSEEAETLFQKYPDSIQMYFAHCFGVFMNAVMTFEDDKLSLALSSLKDVESRCNSDTGWLKSVKKVFGSTTNNRSVAESLEGQIILADSQVCIATLTFLHQDIAGFLKGGWMLRKSWKIYEHAYHEILRLYQEIVGNLPDDIKFRRPSPQVIDPATTTTFDSLTEVEIPDRSMSTDTSASIGYTQPKQYSPNIPHSHTTNLDEQRNLHTNSIKCNSVLSNNISHSSNSCDSSCITESNKSSLSRNSSVSSDIDANGVDSLQFSNKSRNSLNNSSRVPSFLKKSTSVNSALSKYLESKQTNRFLSKISPFNNNLSLSYFTSSFNIFSTNKHSSNLQDIDRETITRLMGAVSFGFGLFNLGVSLLPPSLLKISNLLGFGANRTLGLSNLMYARLCTDMRAPMATLALLWYHTIIRPFYALDGNNVEAGVNEAQLLIEESEQDYADSALFLFFKGRVNRLNSDIPTALKAFQASVDNTTHREIKILSLHEVGWCHLLQLNYSEAEQTFQTLKMSSRWSQAFYTYLEIICSGSCDTLKNFLSLKDVAITVHGHKTTPLDTFLQRRVKFFPATEEAMAKLSSRFWKMFVYELIYLWNALPSCDTNCMHSIIEDCILTNEEPMIGISKLIEGKCYLINDQTENGIASLRNCLQVRNLTTSNADDAHISAFAHYELGLTLWKLTENKEEGKHLLNHISHYKDYDFEQRLTVRIHALLKTG